MVTVWVLFIAISNTAPSPYAGRPGPDPYAGRPGPGSVSSLVVDNIASQSDCSKLGDQIVLTTSAAGASASAVCVEVEKVN